jgi:hypothetical protein
VKPLVVKGEREVESVSRMTAREAERRFRISCRSREFEVVDIWRE